MRNFFLIPMFMYMFLQTCITFVLVGIFYGTFSSIVRSQFTPTDDGSTKCISTELAAVLENIFILMLAMTFVFSTMVDIRESEMGFKLLILGFGLLQLITIVSIILVISQLNMSEMIANIDTT